MYHVLSDRPGHFSRHELHPPAPINIPSLLYMGLVLFRLRLSES